MLKRILCLALAVLFALSLVACGGEKEGAGKKGSSSKKASSGKTDDKKTSGGVTVSVEDKKVLESDLAKATFGGKSYTFYYWYEYGDIIDRRVSEFNKQKDANIKISVISGNREENIAKSIAAGNPYDLFANHGLMMPHSIFADLYEPLEGYISDLDYFDSAKPQNGGISKTVNEHFMWKNKLYACGSAKSVYQYVCYYNKLMFQSAGLEDPYQLWKDGKWTWEKFVQMGIENTDVANNVGWLSALDITNWWVMKGVWGVKREGDKFTVNTGSTEVINATQEYYNLFFGDNPISVAKTGTTAFNSGKAYTMISNTDAYTVYADQAKKSGQFGRNANNLGVVPVPSGINDKNMYPGHAAQGYSAIKGSKDPKIAAAYALFESRTVDSDIGSSMQMPAEIRNYVGEQFAKNGFLGFESLQNSEGVSYRNVIDPLGLKIRNGEDPTSTIANARSSIQRLIDDTMANAI